MSKNRRVFALEFLFVLVVAFTCEALAGQDSRPGSRPKASAVDLTRLVGTWEGTNTVWLRPGSSPQKSAIRGTFAPLLDGKLIRHAYEWEWQGEAKRGEETFAYNPAEAKVQVSWFDAFHMNRGLLWSEGEAVDGGFTVRGEYRSAPGQGPWGWRTEYRWSDDDTLAITAYNITPAGQEAKAVETRYRRVNE